MEIWCPHCKAWQLVKIQARIDDIERPFYVVIETVCSDCKKVLLLERIYMARD